jgi:hypothetical protein
MPVDRYKAIEACDLARDAWNAALSAQVADLSAQVAELRKDAWIPVSERMPENEAEVLVYVPNAEYNKIGMDTWRMQHESPLGYGPSVEIGMMWDNHEFEEVTHWMTLPKPPADAVKESGNE